MAWRRAGRGGAVGGARPAVVCLGSGRRSCAEAWPADADVSVGRRRVAAAAPVTDCVPVSGRGPAGWLVASAAPTPRRALPRALLAGRAPPPLPGPGWRWARSPRGRRRGRRGVWVGCVPPPPVVPPGYSAGVACRVLDRVLLSGSSLETS